MSFDQNFQKFFRLFPEFIDQLQHAEEKKVPFVDEESWLQTPKLAEADLLFIYGVGNGEAYRLLRHWLQENPAHILIFLEPDFGVLKSLLKSKIGTQIFSDSQVELYPVPYNQKFEKITTTLGLQSAARKILVLKDPRQDKETYFSYLNVFLYNREATQAIIQENQVMGGGFFYNFYQNLSVLPSCFAATDLFGRYKNVPAFIVGAGPSLSKNATLLNGVKKKGLVFAGGSALTALARLGVKPDLGFGVDPNKTQKDRLSNIETDYPYLFRMRLHAGALEIVKGDKLYIPGAGGYLITSWFEKEFGLKSHPILEGHNIVNFMTSIAVEMGCNPIIFVGLDLSFTQDKLYAEGVPVEVPFQDVTEAVDIYSNKIATRMVWLRERKWLYEFIDKYPDTQFYNATEGGIVHLPLITLKEFIPTLKEQTILLEYKPLGVTMDQIRSKVFVLRKSLQRLREILLRLYRAKNMENPLWAKMLNENIAYQYIINPLANYVNIVAVNSHLMYFALRDGKPPPLELHQRKIDYLIKAVDLQLLLIGKFFNETKPV